MSRDARDRRDPNDLRIFLEGRKCVTNGAEACAKFDRERSRSFGGPDLGAFAAEQTMAKVFLQIPHSKTDCSGADAQFIGGSGEVLEAGTGLEDAERFERRS